MAEAVQHDQHHHNPDHHVHFSEGEDNLKENEIVVRKRSETSWEIQLGFLQVNHSYEVSVDLDLGAEGPDLTKYGQKEVPVPIHCKLISAEKSGDKSTLKFQFKALHDKVTRESLHLAAGDGTNLEFEIIARVLGKGKGTPMLRSGIRCTAVDHTDETEGSDWKGF